MLPNPLSPSTTLPTFFASLRSHILHPNFRIPLSFFLLGLLNNLLYVIILSAALDLVGPNIPKSLVLLFDVAPSFLVKLLAPYFIHRISYGKRVVGCVVLAAVGMGCVALSPSAVPSRPAAIPITVSGSTLASLKGLSGAKLDAAKDRIKGMLGVSTVPDPQAPSAVEMVMKMGGIALASLASGAGELSFLALTSFYDEGRSSLAAWGSGTGAAGLVGAGAYVLATTTLGLQVRTALLAFSFLPLVMLGAYFVVLPRRAMGVGGVKGEGYAPVAGDEDGEDAADGREDALRRDRNGEEQDEEQANVVYAIKDDHDAGFVAKLRRARSLVFPYMLPLFLVYLSEYTINQGVTPTLLYPLKDTPFKHFRDFYPTYGAIYQLGVFISRSSLPFIRIQTLYIPSLLQWANLFLLIAQAVYFTVLPSVWLVFLVIFWEGLLGGLVYVSTFRRIGEEVPAADKEFSLAATTVSDSAGICLASFLGMVMETSLCRWQVDRGRDWCRRL